MSRNRLSISLLLLVLRSSVASRGQTNSRHALMQQQQQKLQDHSTSIVLLPLIPHWHQEKRRQLSSPKSNAKDDRRRKLDPVQVGALYQGYGTHYVDLWVGTPGQRQTLIVDTGSGVTAFPCSGCTDCGRGHHIDENFAESKSSTFEKVPCGKCMRGTCSGSSECKIGMSYQEGSSWNAFEAKDLAYIGGPHDHVLMKDNAGQQDIDPDHAFAFAFKMDFGCQTKLTGLFKTQLADGIMGMDDAPMSFWAQMKAEGLIKNKKFSLCFTRQPQASQTGTEAGAMTMGGYDVRLHSSPMVYTKRQGGGSGGFYNVHVRKMYLRHGSGGELSKSSNPKAQVIALDVSDDILNHGNVIVDSGTTDTYFTKRIAVEFNKAFQKLSGRSYSHNGVDLTDEELKALPTILIQISGDEAQNKDLYQNDVTVPGLAIDLDPDNPYDVLLAIPPSHYMEYDGVKKLYVARFYPDEGGGSVLGANAMMGHDVFFDLDNKVIGWAESSCDYHNLLTTNGFVDIIVASDAVSTLLPATPSQTPSPSLALFPSQDSKDKSVYAAAAACNDAQCRATLVLIILTILICGICIGRQCAASNNTIKYQAASTRIEEMELSPTLNGKSYRDIPEEEGLPGNLM